MARIRINVTSGSDHEEITIEVPEWDDLSTEDQEMLVQEAAAPAVDRFDPVVSRYEMAD